MKRVAANSDELLRLIEEDERQDKALVLQKLTPIEFARLHGIAPQKVYYHLRHHRGHEECDNHIALEDCLCGKKVLDVEAANRYFGYKEEVVDREQQPEVDDLEDTQEMPGDIDFTDEGPSPYRDVYENLTGDTERYDSPWA